MALQPTKRREGKQTKLETQPKKKRRISDQAIFKIAKRHDAAMIIPDYQISQRKLRHCLYDSAGEHLMIASRVEPLFAEIRRLGYRYVILLFNDDPRPMFLSVRTDTHNFKRIAHNGQTYRTSVEP